MQFCKVPLECILEGWMKSLPSNSWHSHSYANYVRHYKLQIQSLFWGTLVSIVKLFQLAAFWILSLAFHAHIPNAQKCWFSKWNKNVICQGLEIKSLPSENLFKLSVYQKWGIRWAELQTMRRGQQLSTSLPWMLGMTFGEAFSSQMLQASSCLFKTKCGWDKNSCPIPKEASRGLQRTGESSPDCPQKKQTPNPRTIKKKKRMFSASGQNFHRPIPHRAASCTGI